MPSLLLTQETPRKGRFLWPERYAALLACPLLALAWLLPNHYEPWVTFHGEAVAFAALIVLALGAAISEPPRENSILIWVGGVLLAVIALQRFAGQIPHTGSALMSSLYVGGCILAVACGERWAANNRSEAVMVALSWVVVLAGMASLFVALLQAFQTETVIGIFAANLPFGARPFGNLAQPNHFATLICMSIVGAACLREFNQYGTRTYFLLVSFLSLGLAIAESRTALLSALVMGGIAIHRGDGLKSLSKWLVFSWWLVLLVVYLAWRFINPFTARPVETVTQDSARLLLLKQAAAAIEQAPWLGYGFKQTFVAQKAAAVQVPGALPTNYFHNFLIDIVAWCGIPLGIAIALGLGYWLLKTYRKQSSKAGLFGVLIVVPILVHSMLEFPFAYAYFAFPMCFVFGLLEREQSQSHNLKRSGYGLGYAVGLLCFTLASALVAKDYSVLEDEYRTTRFHIRNIGPRPEKYVEKDILVLDQFRDLLWAAHVTPRPGMSDAEISRFERACRNVDWASLQMRFAAVLALNGQSTEAERQLDEIRNIYGPKSYRDARFLFDELTQKWR